MDQLRQITTLVRDALGSNVLGIYLYGSSVAGGLRPASDLDVMVIARRSLDQAERQALADGLLKVSGTTDGGRHVELSVAIQSDVRPWRYPPTSDFLYGDWLREEIETEGPPQPEQSPDLCLLLHMTMAGNHPLSGPPPGVVFDPIPLADVIRASIDGIPSLLADLGSDTRNVLLTLARIWTTVATGEIRSKDAAADWALARLRQVHRPVLAHSRELYLTSTYAEEKPWPADLRAQLQPHVDAVLAEISKLDAAVS